MKTKRIALTPALSRLTGEGETFTVFGEIRGGHLPDNGSQNPKAANRCFLSHRLGEGQGEGKV